VAGAIDSADLHYCDDGRLRSRDCTTVALAQGNLSDVDAPLKVVGRLVKVAYSSGELDGVGRLQVVSGPRREGWAAYRVAPSYRGWRAAR
jgi:hypothetical protein